MVMDMYYLKADGWVSKMKLYKTRIAPKSAFSSPLQGDTFFGAFCWSYRYLYGEEELKKLLQKSMNGTPQIIFSNAYPSGYLPLPMGVYDTDRKRYSAVEAAEAKKLYQENKKYKKRTLVSREAFLKIQSGVRRGYSHSLSSGEMVQAGAVHNTVGRADGMVGSTDGSGSLFVTDEYFVEDGKTFDLYILSELAEKIIQKTLQLMFEIGIGADKSTGKGCFELVKAGDQTSEKCTSQKFLEDDTELTVCAGANGYMAISNFIPAREDPVDGWYKTFVKYGKLDREYAAGQFPFKKPLLYIQAGAVFKTRQPKKWYGGLIKNTTVIPDVLVNACTIALPICIPG